MRFMVMAAERAADHGDDDPENLAQRGPACAACVARGQQRAGQRKGQREHGVLELDHFEDGADAAGHWRLRLRLFAGGAAGPAIHVVLRKAGLREHATDDIA